QLYLFGTGLTDQAIYMNAFAGTEWSGWSKLPSNGRTVALAAFDFRSKLNLFRVDTNHHIYSTSAVIDSPPPNCTSLSVTRTNSGLVLSWDVLGLLQRAT